MLLGVRVVNKRSKSNEHISHFRLVGLACRSSRNGEIKCTHYKRYLFYACSDMSVMVCRVQIKGRGSKPGDCN